MKANLENIHEIYNIFCQKNRMSANISILFDRFHLSHYFFGLQGCIHLGAPFIYRFNLNMEVAFIQLFVFVIRKKQ